MFRYPIITVGLGKNVREKKLYRVPVEAMEGSSLHIVCTNFLSFETCFIFFVRVDSQIYFLQWYYAILSSH